MNAPRRLPSPERDAALVAQRLRASLHGLDWSAVVATATPWIEALRAEHAPPWSLDALLRAYPLSSAAGRALMHLAESLLRIPDDHSALELMADQLLQLEPQPADGTQPTLHQWLRQALVWSGRKAQGWSAEQDEPPWRAHALVLLARQGLAHLSQQFVLGQTLSEAARHAEALRPHSHAQASRVHMSYDMLGEGARTAKDADAYLAAYADALAALSPGGDAERPPERADGVSIKLSALFPRYEDAQRERVMAELLPRVQQLCAQAAQANLPLTLDAEESTRLELMLDVFEQTAAYVAREHAHWRGLGLAVQAYQTRAMETIDAIIGLAKAQGLRLMVRLVKGAYWDSEIKRAQELGLADYPVFIHKEDTDASYLACAKRLLLHTDCLYPQFATHNAGTIAALMQLIGEQGIDPARYEWQRLHGMGQALYRLALGADAAPLRVYAPVGTTQHLLAYLIRRLLENAANTSFVHQLSDPRLETHRLLRSPLLGGAAQALRVPAARQWLGPPHAAAPGARAVAAGFDLSDRATRRRLQDALSQTQIETPPACTPEQVPMLMEQLHKAWPLWERRDTSERCAALRRAADAMEQDSVSWCAQLVIEARKTYADALAEVRETIDYLRYYAEQASGLQPITLPAPTGEHNRLFMRARGVFVCISPWNFPLAIFTGQVAAALVCGNAVAAKPAEQTPAIARRMVELLHRSGVPTQVLHLMVGRGSSVGAALVAHPRCAGVAFTGSTATARAIQFSLAQGDRPIVPLIAETGGINAMIVDSTGLAEQIVDAIVASAFLSAGQRCSALRLLCVHQDIADTVIDMLSGAMQELNVGDNLQNRCDVGPLIDETAFDRVQAQIQALQSRARRIAQSPLYPDAPAYCVCPVAFEIDDLAPVREEIFGPVLQVLRWGPGTAWPHVEALVAGINDLGFGLTLGLQTRIQQRADAMALHAQVGNVYVNRAMTGAVVGVHPFGGTQRSGTGPKAGGPHYLKAFCTEQTVSVNTASIGGNLDLLQ